MRGGVVSKITDEDIDDMVDKILGHPDTRIDYISRGTYGEVFRVTYPGDSGFVDDKQKEVNVFILKVQGIDMRLKHVSEPEPDASEAEYEERVDFYPYSLKIEWDELDKEVRLQQEIYTCALGKGWMPPCPAILFYGSITAEKFERYAPGQLVYKDGYGRLEDVEPIKSRDFKHYRMGIILMEYVDAVDLSSDQAQPRYVAKYQEIEDKALRTYVTALQCGVLQGDPKPQNFLLTEDDNVVLIDFGIARRLRPTEQREINELLAAGNYAEFRLKLERMEPANNKCLHRFIFRPRWKDDTPIKKGMTKYPSLAPVIQLSPEIARQYIAGITTPRPTLGARESLSAETIADERIEAKKITKRDRYDDEIEARMQDKAAEEAAEREPKQMRRGGKRHTKYVGTRRSKRFGTRRKV